MNGPEFLIPIIFFLTIGGIWGFTLLTRHKERMTMIDKGLKAEDIKSLYERGTLRTNPLSSLKWGMIFVSIGLAVLIGVWLRENYFFNDGVIPGIMALFGGLGLIGFYLIANKKISS
ncbi:MAG TPA: DUF6249 domain-containing protein [Bacteroidota bacterium]|nr:DUF6249 domain-containing protein [Bacteroidota bacterium]